MVEIPDEFARDHAHRLRVYASTNRAAAGLSSILDETADLLDPKPVTFAAAVATVIGQGRAADATDESIATAVLVMTKQVLHALPQWAREVDPMSRKRKLAPFVQTADIDAALFGGTS